MSTITITGGVSGYTLTSSGLTAIAGSGTTVGHSSTSGASGAGVYIEASNDTLINYGTLIGQAGVNISAGFTGERITNQSGGLIYSSTSGNDVALRAQSLVTVVNAGTINQGASNIAIDLSLGGSVTNLSSGAIISSPTATYTAGV